MDDFVARFGEHAEAARQAYRRQQEELGRERTRRITATQRLPQHAERRFQELGRAHRGTVQHHSASEGGGMRVHELSWIATKPRRTLRIRGHPVEGGAWWAWAIGDRSTEWDEVGLATFTAGDIDALIVRLADQETWGGGGMPEPPASDDQDAEDPRGSLGADR